MNCGNSLLERRVVPPARLPNGSKAVCAGRILVVEDDPTSRRFLQLALQKKGYEVEVAESVIEALEKLAPATLRAYDCVLSDYRMPDRDGLELLSLIRQQIPSLATIIITAEGEKDLVTESLRGGAADFLDKPVDLEELHAAVTAAVKRTGRQRQLEGSETAVRTVGHAQERMLGAKASDGLTRVEICFHPKHEAGGDFFSRYQPSPDQFHGLLTDVSGHDLQAAYISAYFQGVVRGMLDRKAQMTEIFTTFNQLLLDEWNQADEFSPEHNDIKASIAACAISIDSKARTATLLSRGMPAPVYWLPDGNAKRVGETGGFPLGWFPDVPCLGVIQPIADGGAFCLWTDGLELAAEKNGVSELSLACALRKAKDEGRRPAELGATADDVLVAEVWLPSAHRSAEAFRPLLLEQYHGALGDQIDDFQAYWHRSMAMAVPELPKGRQHDILLATREALLNAMKHGCGGRAGKLVNFQMAHDPLHRTIRVRICDPGPGHHFDCGRHTRHATTELLEEKHRGLFLIEQLASSVDFKNNGAGLTMDFTW